MDNRRERNKTATGRLFEVDMFHPEDAEGIVRIFRSVYGDGYPIKIFYDPKALTDANENGDYYSIVARNPDGCVIGVHHLYRSAPYRSLYEWGVGLVLGDYRGKGVSGAIGRHVAGVVIPDRGMDAVFGESVCNHVHTQKMCAAAGLVDTALEISLMPAAAYSQEKSATGRVATLLQFRCYKSKPRKVFLPDVYEKQLRFMYEGMAYQPGFEKSDEELPPDTESQLEMTVFDFAKVARIAVLRTGPDLGGALAGLESKASAQDVEVFQVWLKLSSPSVGAAVDVLRQNGYFVGGPLPRWFNEDGLLMQKLLCAPDFEAIKLHSKRAERILEAVTEDWERTKKC